MKPLVVEALRHLPAGPPTQPPDLDHIVRDLAIELHYVRDRVAFDGATDLTTANPVVELAWVSPSDSRSLLPWAAGRHLGQLLPHHFDARTRFTLAHEIGHVLLHRLSARSALPTQLDRRTTESVCNSIAAEILMPRPWFQTELGPNADLRRLRATAIKAGVSISATVVRARELGRDLALIMFSLSSTGWSIRRTYGVAGPLDVGIGGSTLLNTVDCRAIVAIQMRVACREHEHELDGQLRRAFRSAVLFVERVDGRSLNSARTWRCPHGQSPRATRRPPVHSASNSFDI